MFATPLLFTLCYPSLSAIEPAVAAEATATAAAATAAAATPSAEPLREFSILAPADNAVITVPPNSTTDVSLRYVVRGFTGRLCLTLTHGQLRYYRGPILHQDPSLLKQYAKGCFEAGQPVTLQGLSTGMYGLTADLRDGTDAVSMRHAPIFFAVAPRDPPSNADAFEPTYEWQEVKQGQSVPSGLDVRLSLDGVHSTLARILPTWRLQVYTRGLGFVRHEVTRHTRLREIEEVAVAAARRRGAGAGCSASLWSGPELLASTLSVDEAQLFSRRASLKLHLEGCDIESAAAPAREEHGGGHVEPRPYLPLLLS